jgi:hypothetical protein
MDGPASMGAGGGFEAGSGYVSISADISGAQQGIAALRAELQSLTSMGVSIPIGGGGGGATLGAQIPSPAGGTSIGGTAGLPTVGAPSPTTFAGFAGLPAAGGGSSLLDPFSGRGLSRALGSGALGFGILELGNAVIAGAGAMYTYDHPEMHLHSLDRLGGTVNPFTNRTMAGGAVERTGLDAANQFEDFLGGIPVLGIFAQAADFSARKDRSRRLEQLGRLDDLAGYLPDRVYASGRDNAAARGDVVGVAEMESQHAKLIAKNDMARAYRDTEVGDPLRDLADDVFRNTLRSNSLHVSQARNEVRASHFDARADLAAAGMDRNSAWESLNLHAQAAALRTENSPLQSEQARADITSSYLGLARTSERMVRSVNTRGRSMAARIGNDEYGASLIEFDADAFEAQRAATPYGIDLSAQSAAMRRGLEMRHGFEMQVAGEGYTARMNAAAYAGNLQPASADATSAVARARNEVAMASKQERPDAILAAGAELEAMRKLTTMQRGGNVALDSGGFQALGMISAYGVDLTGRAEDRKRAGGILQDGQNNLKNAPEAPTVNIPELQKLVPPLLEFLRNFKAVGVSMFQSK